jgi:putative transposase
LAIRGEKRLGAEEGSATLAPLVEPRGAAASRRRDRGPEGMAPPVHAWLGAGATRTVSITPGPPWEHGDAERCLGTWREACLTEEVCRSVEDARVVIAPWRREDNQLRPHRARGYRPPAERPLRAGCGAVPACSEVTQRGMEARQGHRLNILMDQF